MINRVDRIRVSVNDDDASPKHAAVAQSGLAQKNGAVALPKIAGAASDSIFFMVCGNPDSINGGRWCVRHE